MNERGVTVWLRGPADEFVIADASVDTVAGWTPVPSLSAWSIEALLIALTADETNLAALRRLAERETWGAWTSSEAIAVDRMATVIEIGRRLESGSLQLLSRIRPPTEFRMPQAEDLASLSEAPPEEAPPEEEPAISFARARAGCGATPGAGERITTVVPPVPAGVLGYLHKWGHRPPLESLVRVRVQDPTEMKVSVSSDAGSVDLELGGVEGVSVAVSRKLLLPYYDDGGDLGGASWDDIELLDVSAGGDVPFGLRLDAKCGAGQGKLGLMDVVFADPDGGPGRSARYGVFKTREPSAKFVLPELDVSRIRVLLDDGEESTEDELELTALLGLSGEVTSYEFPGWVEREDEDLPGTVNELFGRRRVVDFDEAEMDEEPPGDTALFMLGENRLKLLLDDELLFCTHSFHYDDEEFTVPSGYFEVETASTPEGETIEFVKDSLALDFEDDVDDVAMSRLMHAARLRPRSLCPRDRLAEVAVHEHRDHAGLTALVDELAAHEEEILESVSLSPFSPTDPAETGILEMVPAALHADFVGANDTFTNAALHWHHFVIHTFPAHRLIEEVLFPRARPPIVALSGVQFETNKTFVRPAAFDSIRRIRELYGEDPSRKLAIFGHTDRVGGDDYNNGLSHVRARSVEALLRQRAGFWFDRFGKHTEAVGSDIRDVQWALHRLEYFPMEPTGTDSPTYQDALHAFQSDQGLPEGGANSATRTALGRALRENIGAVGEPLTHEDVWGTREIQQMLTQLGLYSGPINGIYGTSTRNAVRDLQNGNGIGADGEVGIVTRIVMIEGYMASMVIDAFADDRFHQNAVFGCGEAFPMVPTADEVESQQNRRVEVLFRREAIEPIDPPNQLGPLCPYVQWQQPEMSDEGATTLPNVVVAVGDSGFGGGVADDYRGNALTTRNRLLINGERWLRPTDVTAASAANPKSHTVAQTGDLRALSDAGAGHGTAVITCLGSDGIGNPVAGAGRTVQSTVLGTAPHVKLRPIMKPNNFWNNLLCLEVVASDPEVFVYSTSSHLYRATMTAAQRRALAERLQDMVGQGKLALASAGNYRSQYVGEYDTATREFGAEAPDRRVSRSHGSYSGAEAHRQRIAIVGSSEEVSPTGPISAPGQLDTAAAHTYLGEQVSIHMPGVNIRAVTAAGSPTSANLSNTQVVNGVAIGGIGGTSFATPMTAGVVGELLMLDADLTQPANLPRSLEYIEATADPLPNVNPAGGQGAPANPRNADPGPNAGGPPNGAQSPTAATTYQNIRRVHFWKAVLAAVNKGLSSEGRGANGATDPHFQFCTLRDDSATQWYGFEIRSPVPDALLWWRKSDGTYALVSDDGSMMPGGVRVGATWRTVDLPELAAGQPLPAYPWTRARFTTAGRTPYYLCQLSIRKDDLARYSALCLHMPGVDPLDPRGPAGPPILEVPVADRVALRDPAAQSGAADVRTRSLATFGRFSDFVVYLTAVPQAVDSFRFVSVEHRTAVGVGEEIEVWLVAVDAFGNLANPGTITTNVTHDGTAGVAGTPNVGVFLGGAPAAAAGIAPAFGGNPQDHRGVARLRFQAFTQETVTLRFDDGAGHTASFPLEVRPAGALDGFRLELRRRGGGDDVVARPLTVAEPFELEVTAVDAGGLTVGTFNGNVTLRLLAGESGSAGPPARGLHVKNADGDPFDPAAFTMALANGVGTFPLLCYTTGELHLEVEDDANHTGQSRQIQIEAGALAQLRVLSSTPQTTANAFDVEVSALDAHGNLCRGYTGSVTLSVMPGNGTAGATAGDGTRSGAFIAGTDTGADDSHTYTRGDEGIHRFSVTCYTAETVRFRAADTGAGVQGDSDPIVVDGTAIDHFGIEARGADRAGTPFDLVVTALDANDEVVSDYAGTVTLSLVSGTAFSAGPPRAGVRIETAPGTAGNSHTYGTADHGRFTFVVTPYTGETVKISASDGTITSESSDIPIESAAVERFVVAAPATIARNVPFQITVTAQDGDGNTVPGFNGTVTLRRSRNGGSQRAFSPAQSHAFSRADNGSFAYTVRLNRRGRYLVQASDGYRTNFSSTIIVT